MSGDPGAPVPKNQIDPELVKLARSRPRIGAVTAAGIVFLSIFFVLKLNPDRRFAGEPETPRKVTVADIAAGKVDADSHILVDAEPLMAHAVRSSTQKGGIGMRIVPARGSSEKLWLVLDGDGWSEPNTLGYAGRLRPLEDLPLADSIKAFFASHPRPVFARADAARAAFGTGAVTTVAGDTIRVRDTDRVGIDVVDGEKLTIICAFNERHPDPAGCAKALASAGLTELSEGPAGRQQIRYTLQSALGIGDVSSARAKLEAANLWGMTIEPVTQHLETTWGALKASPPAAFVFGDRSVPAPLVDLIGIYVTQGIPDGALVLLGGEKPADYWYVLPVTILVALIGLLFAWAFVRAIKRDFLPPRVA